MFSQFFATQAIRLSTDSGRPNTNSRLIVSISAIGSYFPSHVCMFRLQNNEPLANRIADGPGLEFISKTFPRLCPFNVHPQYTKFKCRWTFFFGFTNSVSFCKRRSWALLPLRRLINPSQTDSSLLRPLLCNCIKPMLSLPSVW